MYMVFVLVCVYAHHVEHHHIHAMVPVCETSLPAEILNSSSNKHLMLKQKFLRLQIQCQFFRVYVFCCLCMVYSLLIESHFLANIRNALEQ